VRQTSGSTEVILHYGIVVGAAFACQIVAPLKMGNASLARARQSALCHVVLSRIVEITAARHQRGHDGVADRFGLVEPTLIGPDLVGIHAVADRPDDLGDGGLW